jgi:hypothetical protein
LLQGGTVEFHDDCNGHVLLLITAGRLERPAK